MATVDELLFRINADTSQMRRQLDELKRKLDRTSNDSERNFRRMSTAARAFGAALAAAFSAAAVRRITQMTRAALEFANTLSDKASVVGLSAEALQEYRFAAASVGVEVRAVDTSLQRFARRVAEAANGTGVLADVFDQYGIAVRDSNGEMRSQEEILADYAEAIANAESEQEQLRLAFKAFDREGAALVNLFRDGADAVEALRQEARDLGAVLSDDLVAKAAEANTRIGQLETAISAAFRAGLLEGVTSEFQTFEQFLASMIPVARDLGAAIGEVIETVAIVLEVLGPPFRFILGIIRELFGAINDVIGAVREFFGTAQAAEGGAEALASAMAAIRAEADGAATAVRALTAETRRLAVEQAFVRLSAVEQARNTGFQERAATLARITRGDGAAFDRLDQTLFDIETGVTSLAEATAGLTSEQAEAVEQMLEMREVERALFREREGLREIIQRLSEPIEAQTLTPADTGAATAATTGGGGGGGGGGASALARALEAVADRAGQARLSILQLGQSAGEIERLRTEAELLAGAAEDGLTMTDELERLISETATASGEAAQRLADFTAAAVLIEDARTPAEEYADEVERLTALLPALIALTGDQAEAQRVLNAALQRVRERTEDVGDATGDVEQFARNAARTMIEGFRDAAASGEGLLGVLNQIATRLADMAVERFIFDPLFDAIDEGISGLFGSGGGGSSRGGGGGWGDLFGSIGSIFGFSRGGIMTSRGPLPINAYAGGGIARGPQMALFAEGRRPEAYVPLPDGRSIPVVLRGGAGAANDGGRPAIYIDARGADASAIAKLERAVVALDRSLEGRAVSATRRAADGGGSYAKAMGRRAV